MNYETQTNKQENEMKEAKEVFVKNAITREKSSWQVRKMINTLIGINKENVRQTIKVRKNILDYKATVKVYDLIQSCMIEYIVFHAVYNHEKNAYSVIYDETLFIMKEELFGAEEE